MSAEKQSKKKRSRSDLALIAIGLFKLVKCILFALAGLGAWLLVNSNTSSVFSAWATALNLDESNRYIHHLIGLLTPMTGKQLRLLGTGAFLYAIVFLIEGIGLVLEKAWAEYMTVIVTSSFIPFEAIELAKRFTPARLLFLGINVAIVVYLILRLWQARKHRRDNR